MIAKCALLCYNNTGSDLLMSNKAKIREDAMKLNPIDDTLFCKMAENIAFCEEILQIILNDTCLKVLNAVPQSTAKNLQGRSCILDLKCQLCNGKIVDIEVQRSDNDDHQRRVLYNAALLITNTTNPSNNFKQVPDVIIIFISEFDIFNKGKAKYKINRVIEDDGTIVYNGMEEIYVNAAVDDKSDIAELMKVFTKSDTYNYSKFPVTSSIKRRFKTTEEGVKEMCEIIERNRAEAAMERLIKSMVSLINKNRITIEEGAEEAELPIDEFKKKIHDLGLAITV